MLTDEVSAQLVPSGLGCVLRYLIHSGLQSFRRSLTSPNLPTNIPHLRSGYLLPASPIAMWLLLRIARRSC